MVIVVDKIGFDEALMRDVRSWPMEQTQSKTNLIAQLAKRKAEAQKAGTQGGSQYFGNRSPSPSRHIEKPLPLPPRGGRNGQGKP